MSEERDDNIPQEVEIQETPESPPITIYGIPAAPEDPNQILSDEPLGVAVPAYGIPADVIEQFPKPTPPNEPVGPVPQIVEPKTPATVQKEQAVPVVLLLVAFVLVLLVCLVALILFMFFGIGAF